jgi:Rieske Fe-S protein
MSEDRVAGDERLAASEQQAGGAPLSNHTSAGRWGVEFPYEWDADDLVSRRQLLRWAVGASGALFAATAGIAGLSLVRPRRPDATQAIIRAGSLAVGDVHYFTYPDVGDQAILLRLAERRFVAYSGKCTHLSCAVYWDAEGGLLRCPCHEGVFDPETGGELAGPPPRPLPKIALREEDGMLYATGKTPA